MSSNANTVYNNVKLCNWLQFYGSDYLSTCNELHETSLLSQFSILTISKLKAINNKSFYCLILILSVDIGLNTGPVNNYHLPSLKEWKIFKLKELYLLHLNVNNPMPKIDELRCIDKLSDAAVIGITELKLDNYILDSEFQINNYQIFRFDRNRKGGGVVCYVRNNLSYIEKSFFPEKIESIFFRVLLPKAKPTTDPKRKQFPTNSAKLDTLKKRIIHSQ